MKKRGETSSEFTGGTIITIGSLVVLIIFIMGLNIIRTTEESACHLSVLERTSVPGVLEKYIPLNCPTEKICLTSGEDCPQFAGFKEIRKEKLPSDEEEAAQEISEEIAEAMYSCWLNMGEGKLDLFSSTDRNFLEQYYKKKKTSCVICDRIAIHPSVSNEVIQKIDMKSYLETKSPDSSGISYARKMTNNQLGTYPKELSINTNPETGERTNEIAIVYSQIIIEPLEAENRREWYLGLAGYLANKASDYQKMIDSQIVAAQCGELSSKGAELNNGCSIITGIDFNNLAILDDYCGRIESSRGE